MKLTEVQVKAATPGEQDGPDEEVPPQLRNIYLIIPRGEDLAPLLECYEDMEDYYVPLPAGAYVCLLRLFVSLCLSVSLCIYASIAYTRTNPLLRPSPRPRQQNI